jgi:GT2 family glycosyltransferase
MDHSQTYNPDLSIILPTKDRHSILFKTLEQLLPSTKGINCEILIVDNSTSSEIQLPENFQRSDISIFKNPGNRNSVFASRNYGASIAKSEQLLFLDDDILVTPECLRFAIEFQKQNPKAAANVSWQYPPELLEKMRATVFGRFLIHAGYTTMRELHGIDKWKDDSIFESKDVASFFLCIQKKTFDEVGGYEERHLHEGTDLSLIENLKRNGIKMYINSQLLAFHNEEDRMEIRNWLERKKRVGEIIANSAAIGDTAEKKLVYSPFKSFLLSATYFSRSLIILFMTNFFSRVRVLDKFRFKFISLLTGAYMYKGYTSEIKRNKQKI